MDAQFGHLFSWRHHPSVQDHLSHAAYRYNHNMMEYYTCKSKRLEKASFPLFPPQKKFGFKSFAIVV